MPAGEVQQKEKMKFIVKACSKSSRARVGLLQLQSPNAAKHIDIDIDIETPALLLTTRKGLPAFISPDHLSSLPSPDSRLLQFSPMHFMEGPNSKTISNIGGVHKLLGLNDYGFVAVPRDSILSLPEANSSNKNGASFETASGRFLVKPMEYMKMISSMKPDLWVSLADEVPASVNKKRNKASVDRTIRWLDDCISLESTDGALFGSIVGGCSVEERQRCAQEVAKRNVSGYYIGGFGLGDNIDERSTFLHAVTDCLPKEKPRQVCGLGLPEEVLQGIAAGIDLFDSAYIYHLTLGGFALVFPLDGQCEHVSDPCLIAMAGDQTKINLKATIYRKDATRIVDGCNCYTCQNHTKAYINHLLNVHEMLAQILLEIHNTHHYLLFFRLVRKAIMEGKFEEFRQKFIDRRRDYLLAASLSVFEVETSVSAQQEMPNPMSGEQIMEVLAPRRGFNRGRGQIVKQTPHYHSSSSPSPGPSHVYTKAEVDEMMATSRREMERSQREQSRLSQKLDHVIKGLEKHGIIIQFDENSSDSNATSDSG